MIYLVGSYHAAMMWGIDEDVDIDPRASEVKVVTSFDRALGLRPRPSDRVVQLHDGDNATYRKAFCCLTHQQELARRGRDISIQQAP